MIMQSYTTGEIDAFNIKFSLYYCHFSDEWKCIALTLVDHSVGWMVLKSSSATTPQEAVKKLYEELNLEEYKVSDR